MLVQIYGASSGAISCKKKKYNLKLKRCTAVEILFTVPHTFSAILLSCVGEYDIVYSVIQGHIHKYPEYMYACEYTLYKKSLHQK